MSKDKALLERLNQEQIVGLPRDTKSIELKEGNTIGTAQGLGRIQEQHHSSTLDRMAFNTHPPDQIGIL